MASDPEMLAMNSIRKTLENLAPTTQKRVIDWVLSKVAENGHAIVAPVETKAATVTALPSGGTTQTQVSATAH